MSKRRGQGFVYRPTYTRDGVTSETKTWWIGYSIDGKKIREAANTTVHKEAVRFLNQRLSERGRGIKTRDLEKVMFDDLADLITADYKKHDRKSGRRLQTSLLHLRQAFAGWRAVDIQEEAIDRYGVDRLAEGAKPASVNREYAALRRAFNLAVRAKMARDVPTFEMITENNTKKGFFEESELDAMLEHLPAHLHPLVIAGYYTGWRREEIRTRQWSHVDFNEGWLRLDPGETKNLEGREFPMIPQLDEVLRAQYDRKTEIERQTGSTIDAVFFHDDGRPIKDFRRQWRKACIACGFWVWQVDEDGNQVLDKKGEPKRKLTKVFHDFRRTAARNLVRSGIPTALAKKFTGHETDAVFQRYAIADANSMKEAAEKYAAKMKETTEAQRRTIAAVR